MQKFVFILKLFLLYKIHMNIKEKDMVTINIKIIIIKNLKI